MGDVAAIGVMRRDLGPAGVMWPPVRARRCLFGPPDPDSMRTILQNETKKIEWENRERWNFNFAEGTPLSGGRYRWTLVTKDEDKKCTSVLQKEDEGSGDAKSEDTTELKQSHITDYMRKRKLSSSQKDTTTAEPDPKARRRFST